MMDADLLPFTPPREVIVEFDGDRLVAVILEGDGVATPVRLLCESIGLDPDVQMANIRAHPVISTGLRVVNVSGERGVRSVAALLHTMIPYWLATIPPNQVNAASRPKLIRYQREVANVLAQLFYGADAVPEPSAADPAVAALQQRVQDALREVRVARDALLVAQQQYAAQLNEQQRQIESLAEIVTELQEYIPIGPTQAEFIQRSIKHLAQRVVRQRSAVGAADRTRAASMRCSLGASSWSLRSPATTPCRAAATPRRWTGLSAAPPNCSPVTPKPCRRVRSVCYDRSDRARL